MPVVGIRLLVIFQPFHEETVFADQGLRELFQSGFQLATFDRRIPAAAVAGGSKVLELIPI